MFSITLRPVVVPPPPPNCAEPELSPLALEDCVVPSPLLAEPEFGLWPLLGVCPPDGSLLAMLPLPPLDGAEPELSPPALEDCVVPSPLLAEPEFGLWPLLGVCPPDGSLLATLPLPPLDGAEPELSPPALEDCVVPSPLLAVPEFAPWPLPGAVVCPPDGSVMATVPPPPPDCP